MKNTYTLEIAAPPERVFNWIYDGDRLLQWLPNLVENEVLRAERNGIGSRFRQIYVENGRPVLDYRLYKLVFPTWALARWLGENP